VLWKDSNPGADREFSDQACRHSSGFCLQVKSNRLRLTRCMQEDGRFEIAHSILKFGINQGKHRGFFRDCHGGVVDYIYPVSNRTRYLGAFFLGPWRRVSSQPSYPETQDSFDKLSVLPQGLDQILDGMLSPVARLISQYKTGEQLDQLVFPDTSRITPGLEYMQAHFEEKLMAHQVAKVCNLSVSRFLHLCKEETGVSFSRYVLDLRLNRAKELLGSGDFSIEQVAQKVGFPSRSYFSRMFRQMVGASPGEYRKKFANTFYLPVPVRDSPTTPGSNNPG
jgi:AraC-like DNA-binding protein